MVHLKRFSLYGGEFVKNEMTVDFEPHGAMNMETYLHEKAPKQQAQYTLYAITVVVLVIQEISEFFEFCGFFIFGEKIRTKLQSKSLEPRRHVEQRPLHVVRKEP